MPVRAVLLLSCPDRPGIVAEVGAFVAARGRNIVEADQHSDPVADLFLQRIEFDVDAQHEQLRDAFAPLAATFSMRFIKVGIVPEIGVAKTAGLETGRGVLVDDELRTSAAGVRAVGECAEHRGTTYGLWSPLLEQARALGGSLAGGPAAFLGSVPATTLQEFVAAAKAKPGAMSYGSAGNGSVHHLTMAVFAARAGIDMLHVPYKGGTALVAALLGGEVQAGWSGIPNVASHIRSGKLKVLAISTARRSASLPEVPTAIEQGYPDFDMATVIGLQAPAGAPREVTARLQAAVAKILRERETAERMTNLGMELMENGTEHYARFLKDDLERYAMAVKAAGMKND